MLEFAKFCIWFNSNWQGILNDNWNGNHNEKKNNRKTVSRRALVNNSASTDAWHAPKLPLSLMKKRQTY
jgi:hypothetical protein